MVERDHDFASLACGERQFARDVGKPHAGPDLEPERAWNHRERVRGVPRDTCIAQHELATTQLHPEDLLSAALDPHHEAGGGLEHDDDVLESLLRAEGKVGPYAG